MSDVITLPLRIEEIVRTNNDNYLIVNRFVSALSDWIKSRPQTFFPDYTEHGASHINRVLASSLTVISDSAWRILTSDDMLCLVLAVCAHDSAMLLGNANFIDVLASTWMTPEHKSLGDDYWKIEWERFLLESKYWDERQIHRIFGRLHTPRSPSIDPHNWTNDDRSLIGEFLRRHHARLGGEILVNGLPTLRQATPSVTPGDPLRERLVSVSGLIARSHGLDLRLAADVCREFYRVDQFGGAHVAYLMAVLRIADFIHIGPDRARPQWLRFRSIENVYSREEWLVNQSIASIQRSPADPEALDLDVYPRTPESYRRIRDALKGLQGELDKSWAVLGEIYGGQTATGNSDLGLRGLSVRRLRSNIDSEARFRSTVNPDFSSESDS